jgi:hypothetical protein
MKKKITDFIYFIIGFTNIAFLLAVIIYVICA